MDLKIIRRVPDKSWVGEFFTNGIFESYSLELPPGGVDRPDGHYDPIPVGRYPVIMDESNRFSRLLNADITAGHFERWSDLRGVRQIQADGKLVWSIRMPHIIEPVDLGARIHWGNTVVDTSRCVLIGSARSDNFVGNSRHTYNEFWSKLDWACRNRQKSFIEILEDQGAFMAEAA